MILNNDFNSNTLNKEVRTTKHTILIPPPMTHEKKLVNISLQIFEMNIPSSVDGIIISKYFASRLKIFKLRLGIVFLIFRILSKVIVVIDRKKETLIELIFISGVRIISPAKRTSEPKM